MENNILDATARVTRELTVSELGNMHGGFMFLKIDGIKGESQDDKHKDEVHVSSYSFS